MINERFVLESRLDQGRFGTVYRAVDSKQSFDGRARPVALWLLPQEFSQNKPALELFKRDFLRVRELIHPAVARVYELDHDGETYFVTSELLDGETLRNVLDHLRPEQLDPHEADEILREVGDALAHAHDLGIVHADVRPENVLITTDHEVKLLNLMSTSLMRTAPFTPGPSGDVRDFAALAYELYTGEPAGNDEQRRRRIKGVPKRRSRAIERALAEPPVRSYASAREFLLDAGLAVGHRPYLAAPAHMRARRAGERSTLRRVAIPIAGLAALAFGIYSGAHFGPLLELVPLEGWLRPDPAERDGPQSPDRDGPRSPDVATLEARPARVPAAREPTRFDGRTSAPAPPETGPSIGNRSVDPAPVAGSRIPLPQEQARIEAAARNKPAVRPEPEASAEVSPEASAEVSDEAREASAEPSEASSEGSTEASTQAPATPAARTPESPAPPTLSLSASAITAYESQTSLTVDIVRAGDSAGPAEIVWWTEDGTAQAGDDYASFGRRIESFAPGETVRTLHVPITSDSRPENDEHFFIHLDPSSTLTRTGVRTTATVTLIDDDR